MVSPQSITVRIRDGKGPPGTAGTPGKKTEGLSDQDILNRLKYLKELKRKGLLSDEEYKKECQEVMDQF